MIPAMRVVGFLEVPGRARRQISDNPTLLANRDARTKINSFQIYSLKVRAQIGPVMSKITGQTL
jgi:hypothetical protein